MSEVDQREIEIGASIDPANPGHITLGFSYKGRQLSRSVRPNQLTVFTYRKFILMVKCYFDQGQLKAKWASINNDGTLIYEGEL